MIADPALAAAADIIDPPKWEVTGRPKLEDHQKPPPGTPGKDWQLWLLEAGRGAGKTEACARHYCKAMRENPGWRGRIIAPTFADAVEACVQGPSGVLAQDPEVTWHPSAAGGAKLKWPGGSEALVLGMNAPRDVDRLRAGGNRHIDWWEETAAIPQLQEAWDQAAFGLRLGMHPYSIGSTTPRSTKAYKALRKMAGVVLRKASLFDNPHLPPAFVERMKKKYEGTRLGQQELLGNLLEDIAGALWRRKVLEASYLPGIENDQGIIDPALLQIAMLYIVVSIDPAATSSENADDTGIIVAGLGEDGFGYVLEDATCHEDPDGWATEALRCYDKWEADMIVGEVNHGGEMVENTIVTKRSHVPFTPVRASRGKAVRAQPVASLYGNPDEGAERESLIKHVGAFPELEDQQCTWVPGESDDSPDRMDALVWAFTHIFLEENDTTDVVEDEDWEPVKIGADV